MSDPNNTLPSGSKRGGPKAARLVVFVVITFVLVITFAWLSARSMGARLAAAKTLDQAIAASTVAESAINRVQESVTWKPSIAGRSEQTTATAAAIALIPGAKSNLQDAVRLADESYRSLNDDERKRAIALKASAEARLKYLDAALPVLQARAQVIDALSSVPADASPTQRQAAEAAALRQLATKTAVTLPALKAAGTAMIEADAAFDRL